MTFTLRFSLFVISFYLTLFSSTVQSSKLVLQSEVVKCTERGKLKLMKFYFLQKSKVQKSKSPKVQKSKSPKVQKPKVSIVLYSE